MVREVNSIITTALSLCRTVSAVQGTMKVSRVVWRVLRSCPMTTPGLRCGPASVSWVYALAGDMRLMMCDWVMVTAGPQNEDTPIYSPSLQEERSSSYQAMIQGMFLNSLPPPRKFGVPVLYPLVIGLQL